MLQRAVALLLDPQFVGATPSQKNLVSFDDAGRIAESAIEVVGHRGSRGCPSCLSPGMNFMMRQFISATGSFPSSPLTR